MAWTAPKSWKSSDTIASAIDELNRIGANGTYIYTGLAAFSNISAQTWKTDWAITDYITLALAKAIDDNIRELATMYNHPYTIRNWAGVVRADWLMWNEWEQTLTLVKTESELAGASVVYCGTPYAGETGGLY